MFFGLSSFVLALLVFAIVFGATGAGLAIGRSQRHRSEHLREPFAALQAALLGMVGLLLAFGLSMAVSRYESRRAAVVADANAIGTTYLRAQTLHEPARTASLARLRAYTDTSLRLSASVPGSDAARRAIADGDRIQRELWAMAGTSLDAEPRDSAPRLYVETLNDMIDMQTTRVATLNNRVPGSVLFIELLGAAVALGLLGAYLALVGRGVLDRRAGRDAGLPAAAGDVRPRPPHARPDRCPLDAADRAAGRDDAPARGARAAVIIRSTPLRADGDRDRRLRRNG